METKTLKHLNTKTWYRLIKVLFFIALILCLTVFNAITFAQGTKVLDEDKTTIKCNLKDKKSFTLKEADIHLSADNAGLEDGIFNYKKFFLNTFESTTKEIIDACYAGGSTTLSDSIYDQQKTIEIINNHGLIGAAQKTQEEISAMEADNTAYLSKTRNLYGSAKARYLDFNIEMFTISPVYSSDAFVELFFIGNITIIVLFEAIRRIFYYISLGKINPKD